MSEQDQMPAIVRAVAEVQAEVQGVVMTGHAPESIGGYRFASHRDIVTAVREAMVKRGLVLVPEDMRQDVSHQGKRQVVTLTVTWMLSMADAETVLRFQTIGCGVDNGDKAPYKAMTGAQKYALRLLFNLPTSDDPEAFQPVPEDQDSETLWWSFANRVYGEDVASDVYDLLFPTGIDARDMTLNRWLNDCSDERFKRATDTRVQQTQQPE